MPTMVEIDNEMVPIKTSVQLDAEMLEMKFATPTRVNQHFVAQAENVASYRPMVSFEYNANGSPIAGFTPYKTKLYRDNKFGFINFYSNQPPAEQMPTQSINPRIFHLG